LGAVETLDTSLIEVTSGSAKYEHQHHAIVWRINRLPKEGQGEINIKFIHIKRKV
jgi:stonin-1/2